MEQNIIIKKEFLGRLLDVYCRADLRVLTEDGKKKPSRKVCLFVTGVFSADGKPFTLASLSVPQLGQFNKTLADRDFYWQHSSKKVSPFYEARAVVVKIPTHLLKEKKEVRKVEPKEVVPVITPEIKKEPEVVVDEVMVKKLMMDPTFMNLVKTYLAQNN
jgi:hypothetical protein